MSDDDEGSQFDRKKRSKYKFRRRVTNKEEPVTLSKQSKYKKGESSSHILKQVITPDHSKLKKGGSSSGYFLQNIQPHKIPLPSDSSDEDYDPDIYPEGTSLDIRQDKGDENHFKSFVSYSDDEAEKEKKEKRSEYKFRKRISEKKRSRKKPY